MTHLARVAAVLLLARGYLAAAAPWEPVQSLVLEAPKETMSLVACSNAAVGRAVVLGLLASYPPEYYYWLVQGGDTGFSVVGRGEVSGTPSPGAIQDCVVKDDGSSLILAGRSDGKQTLIAVGADGVLGESTEANLAGLRNPRALALAEKDGELVVAGRDGLAAFVGALDEHQRLEWFQWIASGRTLDLTFTGHGLRTCTSGVSGSEEGERRISVAEFDLDGTLLGTSEVDGETCLLGTPGGGEGFAATRRVGPARHTVRFGRSGVSAEIQGGEPRAAREHASGPFAVFFSAAARLRSSLFDESGVLLARWEDSPERASVTPVALLRQGGTLWVISSIHGGPDLAENPGRHIRILEFELPPSPGSP